MLKYKIWLFLGLFLVTALHAFSQPAVGEWTDYQSYAHAEDVVDTGDKIYCVTEGCLFSYNKIDNSIQKLSGINGLSDIGVKRLAYSKENNLLLIAYQNANIDLMMGNEIFNLSDIKRKSIAGDKTINNVLFVGNLAYLSCGFGIVVVNLERKEIKDTYFIGPDGDYLSVLSMATDGTYFYAATANGIYKSLVSEPNLQNYNNWVRQTNIPHFDQKFSQIINFKGKIIANYNYTGQDDLAKDEMYLLNGNNWTRFLPDIHYVSDVTSNGNYIVFSSRESVSVYNERFELAKYVDKYSISGEELPSYSTKGAVLDDQNILWIADMNNGLIKIGTETERIVPEGPMDNKVFSLTMNGNDLWVASGGLDASWGNLWAKPKFQLNREGKWTVFDEKDFQNTNDFRDIVCIAVDPKNPDHVFVGSWGGGVLEFDAGKFVKRFDNFNSTLETQLPENRNAPYVRIGGLDFDSKGTLWVSNTGVGDVLSSYDMVKKEWKSYNLSGIANEFTGKVLVTQNDDKWIIVPRGKGHELYALNSANDKSKEQRLVAYFSNGKDYVYTEMNNVFSIAEDNNGELWIGTSIGVAVYSNPERVWGDEPMYATRPGLNLNDTIYHPLLSAETITAIAVDGANRKWFGTKNSGVYLISAEGETEIRHFNSDNSPLPSNEIMDIAINQNTGEVYFATGAGLISYMGEATAGNQEFNDVYVYPNPVRETYDGPIVVKGLVDETDVKITDITGNLVYKTTSLGGQAIWDGKNLNGNRCKTGVYLVFLNDATGDKTKITKLLFIH